MAVDQLLQQGPRLRSCWRSSNSSAQSRAAASGRDLLVRNPSLGSRQSGEQAEGAKAQ